MRLCLSSMPQLLRGLAFAVSLFVVAGCVAGSEPTEDEEPPTGTAASDFDYEEYLEGLQEAMGIVNPPPTEMIRLVAADEKAEAWRSCMQEAGWAVSVTFDGGLASPPDLSPEQFQAYERSHYVCHAQYPVDPSTFPPPFGAEQIEILYRYYVEELTPCLEARGYEVEDPPTLEVFQDEFTAAELSWVPYDAVPPETLSEEAWAELNLACPQSPSDEVLYPAS